ncbi:CocE/NonD family hydrolase [Amycolatopsis sp., V23-08]|uniref:CocE/NonD family hydrolase n=1 Tax=Amycolatopsis heterodermiae TaxID=3110235 RepID=A0ABU5R292_9PSEU|nr:CocE/NonD family hydrolase [Amycolatopsis sp., V23-08]MEA5360307.1 CocE/NonD family hydrolase [Amycolatopsis sp., V23-08]
MTHTGFLAGPISGLKYETPTHQGFTGRQGEFRYEEGERVAFLVGATPIGNVSARPRVNLAQIVARVDGDVAKLRDPGLTNVARFVFTLGRRAIRDAGTEIAPEVHDIVGDRRIDFRHDADFAGAGVADKVQAFADDPVVAGLLRDLNEAGVFEDAGPRTLCTPANARNEVRRNVLGILRFRDVAIPLGNGGYVLADVFRPDGPGSYPVVISSGPYGKAFNHHSIGTAADLEAHELIEDDYFSGNPGGQPFENHETVNTASWVPDGYAVVRTDMPGAGATPGRLAPWGIAGAEALRDCIEWAGGQPWSNGNVGTWGMSYLAMSQHQAASLHPKHLKAMIAIGTDVDLYEEVAYNGGIFNEQFWSVWKASGIDPAIVGEPDVADFLRTLKDSPFRDSDPDAVFGPRADVFMSPDLTGVTVPLWAVAATTHVAHFHQLGGSNAYLATPTADKKLDVWDDWFQKSYAAETVAAHKAFFDHWLKGIDNGIMDTPPVRLEIRSGNGAAIVRHENEWPVARTEYRRWYFDAASGERPFFRLSTTEPTAAAEVSYSAEIALVPPAAGAALRVDPASARSDPRATGISFLSAPLPADAVLAGYGKVGLVVSASSHDMDVYVSVRVVDEAGREVDFTGFATSGFGDRPIPLMKGWLKASHRRIDEARSTACTVKHTHRQADHAPLVPGEAVEVEIELIPSTGLLRKGHRIRVDVQPYDGVAHGMHHAYDPAYHDGAVNTIHTGPSRLGYVQLPII